MRLPTLVPTLAALASFATITAADSFELTTWCGNGYCDSYGWWTTCCGRYWVDNANDGCHYGSSYIGVPGMNTICMDWNNRRAHFYFDGQAKRCIAQNSELPNSALGGVRALWLEVLCNW